MAFLLAVDIVVIAIVDKERYILLIKRKNNPFRDKWALPGGFVEENEDVLDAAYKELKEETGLKEVNKLYEVGFFSKVGRDPRGRVCSFAFLAMLNEFFPVKADSDAKQANWFKLNELPPLAFDHNQIIQQAIEKLHLISQHKH